MPPILKRIFLNISFLFFSLFIQEVHSVRENHFPNRYAFYQQKLFDDGCHIFPRLNYPLWQKYKERTARSAELLEEEDFIPTAWAVQHISTSLEAFYRTFDYLLADEEGAFRKYYEGLTKEFTSIRGFTDEDGSLYHKVFPTRVITKLLRSQHAPYQCFEFPIGMYIHVPTPCYLTKDGKMMRIHDAVSKEVREEETPLNFTTIDSRPFLVTPHTLRGKLPRNVGLFELILFMNGIDRDNNPIDEHHNFHAAYKDYRKKLVQVEGELYAPGSHPYSQALPTLLLESVVAKILSQNPELKDKFLKTIDFCLTPWKHYQTVYHPSYPGKKAKDFMPCEDLMLAFYISQASRFVYTSAISNEAFLEVIECEDSKLIRFLQTRWAFKTFPSAQEICEKAAHQKRMQGSGNPQKISFLEAWEELVPLIVASGNTAFHSFDCHGSVRVFKEDTILQDFTNPEVGRRLQMHVIDSSYEKNLGRWYTRRGTEDDFLPGTR
ncbi:MAG TPA: hypothetical protein PLY23_08490 [Alphaproteobacteria bacterium]|nr:hypothetical protein [Alphaproteobacteria bacterium]HQS94690.1 hypothetical protein [Alphaproteobacteria bacterium]